VPSLTKFLSTHSARTMEDGFYSTCSHFVPFVVNGTVTEGDLLGSVHAIICLARQT